MNKNKHLLLWSSVGVFALLVIAAGQEHFGKEWRVVQQASRSTEGPVDVRLRQIVNPGLNIVNFPVHSILDYQIFVAAHLCDLAFVHHEDQVSIHDRLDAMGDDESGAILHQAVQCGPEFRLRFSVHT